MIPSQLGWSLHDSYTCCIHSWYRSLSSPQPHKSPAPPSRVNQRLHGLSLFRGCPAPLGGPRPDPLDPPRRISPHEPLTFAGERAGEPGARFNRRGMRSLDRNQPQSHSGPHFCTNRLRLLRQNLLQRQTMGGSKRIGRSGDFHR